MFVLKRVAILALAPTILSNPCQADFLLNCRLMSPEVDHLYRQACKWETIISNCSPNTPCTVKRQNVISISAKAVLTANARLRSAVIVSSTTSGTASTVVATKSPATLAMSSRATASGSSISSPIGGATGAVAGVVSGATGAVDGAVAGLTP
jgi:hypothetical protein